MGDRILSTFDLNSPGGVPYPASVKPLLDDLLFSLAFARSWGTKQIAPCPDLVGLDAFAARIGSHELVRNRTESARPGTRYVSQKRARREI